MRTCAIALLLAVVSSANGLASQRQQPPKLEESVLFFYVGEFQKAVNGNQVLLGKALPFLKEFIQNRFEISARRLDTVQQLRMLSNRANGNEEEIRRAIREFDQAESDMQTNQERFLANIDPLLNVRQQARVRIFLRNADRQMLQLLNSIRAANAAPPPAEK
jgi:hypothetical protein